MIANSGWCTFKRRAKTSNFSRSCALTKYWSMFSTVISFDLILTISGSFINSSAILRIGPGIVAENNNVWRSAGTCSKIELISSMKPMFNISSASSSTSVCTSLSFSVRRLIWSIIRPGVPTIICGLFLSARI